MSTPISIPDSTVTVTDTFSYHGFNAHVHSVDLFNSVTLRVNIAYLKNGSIDSTSYKNDGTYSYMTKYYLVSGSDYTNWGNDDTYITNYVANNISAIINSTYNPPFTLPPHLDTI
jgi:hypothetical protein